jgi:hypothetical protein
MSSLTWDLTITVSEILRTHQIPHFTEYSDEVDFLQAVRRWSLYIGGAVGYPSGCGFRAAMH